MTNGDPKRSGKENIGSIGADSGQTLRERAEERYRSAESERSSPPSEDISMLLHELRVHQIELEMQNEELRRAQNELSVSHGRYFDLYDTAPVAYLSISDQGLILEANLTAAVLLGAGNRNALAWRPLTHFIVPADQDIYYAHHKKLFDTGAPQVFELRMQRDGESELWVRLDEALEENAARGRTVCRAILTDVTERKRSENEKMKLQEQLVQAMKLEVIGKLAGGVAHEFNNMLGVIQGNAELALGQVPPDDPLHSILMHILQAARRSAKITARLLAFARKQQPSPEVIDLNSTLEAMLNTIKRLIGEDIDLVWRLKENLWPVKLDPLQVDQILTDICLNARDAIDGKGNIIIETENVSIDEAYCRQHTGCIPGEYVMLAVQDSGRGMDREIQGHLFEPFFSTKDVGQGPGLGLAAVHGIVAQNNGFINVISRPGQGTAFKIYLPRHAGQVVETQKLRAAATPRGNGETLLLVEDEPPLLEMAAKILGNLGYIIIPAPTPVEAIRIAEEHAGEIRLLITDVMMPGMNGQQLAQKLMAQNKRLKCLFMSGYAADAIAPHGVMGAGVAFIQKPFSMKDMANKVRTLLDE
jgi:PAS domain S-box-containing protein